MPGRHAVHTEPLKSSNRSFLPLTTVSIAVLSLLYAFTANAQTKWFKYEGNPVLDIGPPGSWDGALVTPSRVILEDSVYKMWYTGFFGARYWQVGYATSRDGIRWVKHKFNPVLKPGPESWDNSGAAHGFVVDDGSLYHMWYTGGDDARTLQIGYAGSRDGIIWTKALGTSPVLKVGPPGSWDYRSLSRPSVIGPDEGGSYKMWYAGEDPKFLNIGFAAGTDTITWRKHPEPVLTSGSPGSWDEHSVFFPRVLHNNGLYEMWYDGMRTMATPGMVGADHRIGYAESSDGIHWRKSRENPVLVPGSLGSWDGGLVLVGDILFDGRTYHMWYSGVNEPSAEVGAWRTGYAVSPKGIDISVNSAFVHPGDPVQIGVKTTKKAEWTFSGEIRSSSGKIVDNLDFADKFNPIEGTSSTVYLSATWTSRVEDHYFADLLIKYRNKGFRLHDAAAFTTIGPVVCERIEFVNGTRPVPGDTVLIKLVLGNRGRSAPARSIEASISAADSLVRDIVAFSPTYGDIKPGGSETTVGYYRLFIHPDCPPNTDVRLNLSISSSGIFLWRDAFVFRVLPHWWRTEWAYALYVLVILGSIVGTIRYVEVKKLKRAIEQLEKDRGLERERTRISQDMHDEVGARLTEIGILSELARKDIKDPRQAELQIQKISQTSREVIANISEIIWAINAKNDLLDDLVAYLRDYTSKYLGTTAIKCTFDIPDEVPTHHLSTEARRNIFLVVKETLHNVVKHSGATEVLLRISFSAQNIEITIEDNGKGFGLDHPSRFSNGLRNMEKRMKDIRGLLTIWSRPGEGTKVTLGVGR